MTPIVLHHGLMGHGDLKFGPVRLSYFKGIDRGITSRGYPLIVTGVHPTAGVETRARQLKETILARLRDIGRAKDRFIIIAHSMGGLDARYMLTHLGMGDRVAALVTVSTPHRGSPYADWCVTHLGRRLGALGLLNLLRLDVQGAIDVTTTRCAAFNEAVPDAPGVRYFSVSAARPWNKIPPFALHAWRVVHAAEGDNDSLVSVKSAQWGEHLGTWPADHWLTINHRFTPELRQTTGDITGYWLEIVDRLVNEGLIEPALALPAPV